MRATQLFFAEPDCTPRRAARRDCSRRKDDLLCRQGEHSKLPRRWLRAAGPNTIVSEPATALAVDATDLYYLSGSVLKRTPR
jgi:hypothetical protein